MMNSLIMDGISMQAIAYRKEDYLLLMSEYIYQWVVVLLKLYSSLMKESKIKSFLEMIKKVGSQAKGDESKELYRSCANQHGQASGQQPKKSHANLNRGEGGYEIEKNRLSLPPFSQKNEFGIYFTKETIKNRYEDKRNLYELYRESLEKKKNSFISIPEQDKIQAQQYALLTRSRQLSFPINRNAQNGRKILNYEKCYTYQKLIRRKSTLKGNISVPVPVSVSERIKSQSKELSGEENLKDMRKRLDYKPLFRVKRVVLESIKNDCPTTETLKEESANLQKEKKKKTVKAKTEQTEPTCMVTLCRERKTSNKKYKRLNINVNQRFSAWETEVNTRDRSESINNFIF